jgi:exopolysaccharide biosynthesis polyprenyl glycosylphosphotransferase
MVRLEAARGNHDDMKRTEFTESTNGTRLLDLSALVVALPLADSAFDLLRGGAATVDLPDPLRFHAFVATALTWGAASWMHQLYHPVVPGGGGGEAGRLVRTVATAALVVAALGFVTRHVEISRLLIALYFGLVLAIATAGRIARRVAGRFTQSGSEARRYAIVGSGGMAREIVETVDAHPEWGMRFAGFIRLERGDEGTRGPILGTLANLGRILEEEVVDVVIYAVPREQLGQVERSVHVCEELGVEVRISLDVLRFGPGRMAVADMDGVPMLAFTRTPSDALALALKRAFDVAMSALVLLVLSPVLAAVAIAIRIDSPGPIFFRQKRVGQNGRAFEMLKFRSMYRDAEARLEALRAQNEMSGPVFKMTNDPRVTKVGRFLRRTSLDEFPQFWNVLKGEMSIVGPRPPIPAEVRQYKRWQRRRLSMKPGITCIWQVSGRNNIDFERWMELDLQYIDEWSLWGDIEICFRTIPAVLSTRGAR